MSCEKRKHLTIRDKVNIIEASEKINLSSRKLADKFGIGKTQVNDILKNKNDIKILFETSGNLDQKRKFPKTSGLAIDQIVFNWYCAVRKQGVSLTGPLLKEKALEAAKDLHVQPNEFKASNGWLDRFCQRHKISLTKSAHSESNNKGLKLEFLAKFQSIMQDYNAKDIFIADETGLLYQALPCGSNEIEKLTILLCLNMEGHKEKPLVIGKSKNPRHLGNIEWALNKDSWMTRDIMTNWLRNFDLKMKKEQRNVVLFLDNAPSHPNISLEKVKLIFLPSHYCQPMGQGIIQNFKVTYRNILLRRLVASMDREESPEIPLTDALIWVSAAWKELSPEIVKNAFLKSGFSLCDSEITDCDVKDNILLATLFSNSKYLDLKTYALVDEDLLTEDPYESEILKVKSEGEELATSISSLSEAHEKLKDLENYFLSNNSSIAENISQALLKCDELIFDSKFKEARQ